MVPSAALTVNDIWKLSQKSDQMWGISAYEVPAKHFDHAEAVRSKDWMDVATGKKKRPKGEPNRHANKGLFTESLEKKFKETPEPWRYDLQPVWAKGSKDDTPAHPVSKSMQSCRFRWQNVPSEKQVFAERQKNGRGKPDMNAKKYTFIDLITAQNSKPNYPRPGPQEYFMDEKAAKRLYPDKADLILRKNGDSKQAKESFG